MSFNSYFFKLYGVARFTRHPLAAEDIIINFEFYNNPSLANSSTERSKWAMVSSIVTNDFPPAAFL